MKRALLHRKSVTRGELRRRRFVDAVGEGIAQLAHYRDYFRYPDNTAYAEAAFGVKVDRPRLVLVAGSLENVVPTEVAEAKRGVDADFELIDYDTLCSRIIGPNSNTDASLATPIAS